MSYIRQESDASVRHQWRWMVGDGSRQKEICAEREVRAGVEPDLVQEVTVFNLRNFCAWTAAEPDAIEVPTRMPTVESLDKAWRAYAALMDLPDGPITWNVEYLHDGEPRFEVGILHLVRKDQTVAAVTNEEYANGTAAKLTFDRAGRLSTIHLATSRSVAAPAALDSGSDEPLAPSAAYEAVPVWIFPDASATLAAATAALLMALLYWLFPYLKQGAVAPLFSRITRDRALDNPARAAMMAAIEAEPGIHGRELQRRLELARGQAQHHLEKLVEAGLVGVRQVGGYACYYPAGSVSVQEMDGQGVLRSATAQRVLEAWQADPEASGARLAKSVGLTRQAVEYHRRRLRAAGLAPS